MTDSTWVLDLWTIYQRPLDFPQHYVARRWEVRHSGPRPTADIIVAEDIERLRDAMRARGLHNIGRKPGDEAQIVESWI